VTQAQFLPYNSIRALAETIGERHEIYQPGEPADLYRLVRDLGGQIAYSDDPEALHVERPDKFTINIPNMTSSRRDRFTIAHELGHYFLHYRLQGKTGAAIFGRGERNKVETQANVFASALLMPAETFKQAFTEFEGDVWALARYFDVSPASASVRAEVLQLA